MSQSIRLTSQAICEVLRIERHTLRRWLDGVPLFAEQPTRARSARRFDMADVLLLSAVHELEARYGLSLAVICRFAPALHEALQGRDFGRQYLFLDLTDDQCFSPEDGAIARPGIMLDLRPVYQRVAAAFSVPTLSPELPFASQPMATLS